MPTTEHHETWLTEIRSGAYALLSDGEEVDTAVIFIHGFLGDPQGTWLNFQEFICAAGQSDVAWARCDVFFFPYPSFRQDITESATQLLQFIDRIFPQPPASIFYVSKRLPGIPDVTLDLSSPTPEYKTLVLVGHSEGGVVIRRAVDLAYNWKLTPALHSRLALFAPAQGGVKLSGWIGACLAVGRIDAIAMPILRFSPAFSEMKDKGLLDEIKEHTGKYLEETKAKNETLESLRAHVVYGSDESVVVKAFYTWDCYHPSEAGKNHVSVCKPRTGYDAPLKFVLDRVEGVDTCTGLKPS